MVSIMAGDAIDSVINVENPINNGSSLEAADTTGEGSSDDNEALLRVQIATSLCLLVGIMQVGENIQLKYIFRGAIFGAEMGRDAGHYCDVLYHLAYICLLLKCPSFYSIHRSVFI